MKKIETNDWIIIQSFGAPVRFADGTIVIYGSESAKKVSSDFARSKQG